MNEITTKIPPISKEVGGKLDGGFVEVPSIGNSHERNNNTNCNNSGSGNTNRNCYCDTCGEHGQTK